MLYCSIVSGLTFNQTNKELSFTASGATGTTGYARITITKSLIKDISEVKVYLDGNQINYDVTSSSIGGSWLLYCTFQHSVHKIVVRLGLPMITVSTGSGGSVSPSGVVTVDYGSDKSFTITPSAGYHVRDVLMDGRSVGEVSSYTFQSVTVGHTIAVSFEINAVNTIPPGYIAGAALLVLAFSSLVYLFIRRRKRGELRSVHL
ncbi:MAG: hypothetical protein V1850_02795 [Candidatus Bathyarchaeota archaeon]